MPEWFVSLLIGFVGALMGLVGAVLVKRMEIRISRGSTARERDSELLAELRENAGWIKEYLLHPDRKQSYQDNYLKQMQRLQDLRGFVAHHHELVSFIAGFKATAEMVASFAELLDSEDRTKMHTILEGDFERLVAKINGLT